ncbi:MAG: FHA domain-containing protein [Acidimicrobiia bacterium]|nr:FHA domain-containing protein [Acidimicrobiia bacterium]
MAVLDSPADDSTTISFSPDRPAEPVEEDVSVELENLGDRSDTGVLVVKRGPKAGSRFALDRDLTTAGRHPESEIFLDDITGVAPSRRDPPYVRWVRGARNVGSLNGTYLNRERIERALLENGDELQIGKFKLVYFAGQPA